MLVAHAGFLRELAAAGIWHEVSMREYDVLYTLSKCDGPVRQGELEGHVLLSQPAISRLISRLVRRGLIARSADPADGRGVRLALTEAGRSAQRRIGARHALDVSRAMAARLDPSEIEQLRRLASKLAEPQATHEGGS